MLACIGTGQLYIAANIFAYRDCIYCTHTLDAAGLMQILYQACDKTCAQTR